MAKEVVRLGRFLASGTNGKGGRFSRLGANISKTVKLLWCWARILHCRSCFRTCCGAVGSGVLVCWRGRIGKTVKTLWCCGGCLFSFGSCRCRRIGLQHFNLDAPFLFFPTKSSQVSPDTAPNSHDLSAVPEASIFVLLHHVMVHPLTPRPLPRPADGTRCRRAHCPSTQP